MIPYTPARLREAATQYAKLAGQLARLHEDRDNLSAVIRSIEDTIKEPASILSASVTLSSSKKAFIVEGEGVIMVRVEPRTSTAVIDFAPLEEK